MDKIKRDLENGNDIKNRELEDLASKLRRLEHDVRVGKALILKIVVCLTRMIC